MRFKSSKLVLGSVSLLAASVASASAPALKPQAQGELSRVETSGFAQWLEHRKQETRPEVTDQLLITFKRPELLNALKKGGNIQASLNDNQLATLNLLQNTTSQLVGQRINFAGATATGQAKFATSKAVGEKAMRQVAERLSMLPGIQSAEADPRRYPLSQSTTWGIPNVQADQLSDNGATGKTVCIIDSGYDISHSDLSGNNHDGTNDSGTGNWYEPGGSHGTHVAGTIAAVNNSEGVVGVLPNQNINLHIVKVFTESGWAYSSDLAAAVDTCVNNGSDVVNMSLGGGSSSTTEENALQSVADNNVLLIAAAGNDGNSSHSYPASYDAVMSVAAVDEGGQHAEFSQYTNQVEIAAPGEAILSTVGVGDGRQATLTWGSNSAGIDGILPQNRYVESGGNYNVVNVNGSASGELAACSTSGTSFSCGDMTNKLCVVERAENQSGSNYPEIDPVLACVNAGAEGVVVYSNDERPGLQNPYLVDQNGDVSVPTVSVNQNLGEQLAAAAGTSATLNVQANTDYAYYNGTSMATPHVSGVAALVWANNTDCSASDVRSALTSTAQDLDVAGRDDRTGYGLVQAKAASDALAGSCSSDNDNGTGTGIEELTNGQTVSSLSGSKDEELAYKMVVPEGATDLSFDMTGGSGDADLYVRFGSEPTTDAYDCRPWKSGNEESCSFASPQTGTYYVKVIGYSSFSGVSLTGSFTEDSGSGSGGTGGTASAENVSATSGNWDRYTVDIPEGMAYLDVTTTGGSGDGDLYLRFNNNPTTSTYECRSWNSGNEETCRIDNPSAGTWHIGIHAYTTFSGMTINAEWQP